MNSIEQLEIPFQPSQGISEVCTWSECGNGHRYHMDLAVVKCPGCKSPMVAMRMFNCPVCNEPATKHVVRCDYCGSGKWVGAVCRGQESKSEVMVAEMVRDLGQLELEFEREMEVK